MIVETNDYVKIKKFTWIHYNVNISDSGNNNNKKGVKMSLNVKKK